MMSNQKGQVILILILVMTVALAIGLSVIQRSLSDVSTATKLEQSSRAFSAAEAGIEKAIQQNSSIASLTLDNNASIQEVQASPIPTVGQALEYPPLAKEELAHVWLADPSSLNNYYTQPDLDIYWGSAATSDKPALELTLIYYGTNINDPEEGSVTKYRSKKFLFESDSARASSNRFNTSATCPSSATITTNYGSNRSFLCNKTINVDSTSVCGNTTCLSKLVLLRARLLYNSTSQPFAVQPKGSCSGTDTRCSLPPQANIFTATGISGQTQRKVQVFRLDKVVPPYFDYAIFSAGPIDKY